MSLFSAIILPKLEKELIAMEPEMAAFLLWQFKLMASEVIEWAEKKMGVDVNGDGLIGDDKDENHG